MTGELALLGVLVLGYLVFRQRGQIAALERRVAQVQGDQSTPTPTEPAATAPAPAKASAPATAAENPRLAARSARDIAPDKPQPEIVTPDRVQPRAFVFRAETVAALAAWLKVNWFLAIAALSLALAGVFLVQYGVEHGIVTPFWRVISAACLGIALIWFGEVVRRRAGDEGGNASDYLPSTFSGAGLVALFAAVLSAHHLYGFIGPGGALVWLVLVAVVAVALGWFYGPFLTVVGILGSTAAPFLVGGQSDTPELFYYYFALIAAAALFVDAFKRWAWVSAFALIFTFGASWMLFAGGAGDAHYLAFGLIAAALSVAVPTLSLVPGHTGPTVLSLFGNFTTIPAGRQKAWPAFPTRLAFASFAAAAGVVLLVARKDAGEAEVWLAIASLALLFLGATIWCRRAPALDDLAVIPPVAFLLILADQAISYGTLYQTFINPAHLEPEAARPLEVSILAAIALIGSALAHWRGLFPGQRAALWSAGAALFAPVAVVLLELTWSPTRMLGAGAWAGHVMVVAAAMVLFAIQTARRDGADRRRTALFALSVLTMISLALILVLSSTALTLALAGMVLGAAVIDQRLNLRPVTVLVHAGAAVIAWRLIVDPGLVWAGDAPLWEVLLAYLGTTALLAASALTLRQRSRKDAETTAESAVWVALALLANVLIYKAMGPAADGHAVFSLQGLVWLVSMANQLYRLRVGGPLRWVRVVLSVIFGLVAAVLIGVALLLANPLDYGNPVAGPLVFDSLFIAYLLPALPLALIGWRFDHLPRVLRAASGILAALFASFYTALEIRRFWHGRDLSAPGVLDGELYSYTVALLLASVALLFIAFWQRSHLLRQVAVAGVTLTIAKVFLIDMAGLAGLYRVASFLGLGLSLAGLAWIVRRMTAQWDVVPASK